MKNRFYILAVLAFLFIVPSSNAQKKEVKDNQTFDILHIDGKLSKNQLLLEFLAKNSRFGGSHLKKMIEIQRNSKKFKWR